MSNLPWLKYQSHKVVEAARIVEIGSNGTIYVEPHPGQREVFDPTEDAMCKHAVVGAWALKYPDGFRSIHPASFPSNYTEVG